MLSDEEKVTLGRRGFLCMDCGSDTYESNEFYMFADELWEQINPEIDGMLCLVCAEDRLGRPLIAADFTPARVNAHQARLCPALAERMSRHA